MITLAAALRTACKESALKVFHGHLHVYSPPSPPSCVREVTPCGGHHRTSSSSSSGTGHRRCIGYLMNPAACSPRRQQLNPHRRCLTDLCCPWTDLQMIAHGTRWMNASPWQSWLVHWKAILHVPEAFQEGSHPAPLEGIQARNTLALTFRLIPSCSSLPLPGLPTKPSTGLWAQSPFWSLLLGKPRLRPWQEALTGGPELQGREGKHLSIPLASLPSHWVYSGLLLTGKCKETNRSPGSPCWK